MITASAMADEDVQIVERTLERNRGYPRGGDIHGANANTEASASQHIVWHGKNFQTGMRMHFTDGRSSGLY